MPNGRYILNDLEFDKEIKDMTDRQLMEFSARLSYSNAIRIISLEGRNKRTMGAIGGVGAIIGAALASAIDYFIRR